MEFKHLLEVYDSSCYQFLGKRILRNYILLKLGKQISSIVPIMRCCYSSKSKFLENLSQASSLPSYLVNCRLEIQGYTAVCKASPENTVTSPNGSSTRESKKIAESNAPACIILEPTKELAEQTDGQLKTFKKYLKEPIIR